MNESRGIGIIGVEDHHHIQSQKSEICQILSCQRLSLQVSMNEAKSSQPENSGSITGEVRNRNSLLISHHDEFDRSSAAYQNADLSPNFIRKFTKEAGNFRCDNLSRGDFLSVDVLDSPDLIRL